MLSTALCKNVWTQRLFSWSRKHHNQFLSNLNLTKFKAGFKFKTFSHNFPIVYSTMADKYISLHDKKTAFELSKIKVFIKGKKLRVYIQRILKLFFLGHSFILPFLIFLAVQPAVRWTALILWVEGEEEGTEEVILAFWAVECNAIVLRAFLENYWALLSMLTC